MIPNLGSSWVLFFGKFVQEALHNWTSAQDSLAMFVSGVKEIRKIFYTIGCVWVGQKT